MLYGIAFAIGSILVTYLLFVLLGQRNIRYRGETADIRFVGLALVLIILTAVTLCAMLLLGKQ